MSRRWVVAGTAVLAALVTAATAPGAGSAAFTGTSSSPSSSITASNPFPTFRTLALRDAPSSYLEENDAGSTSATPTQADSSSSSPARPGTLNGPSSGLSTWWRFDGDTTSATDSSGAVNSGTVTGSATLTGSSGGFSGGGVTLNGSSTAAVVGSSSGVDTSRSFTAAVWVKTTDLTSSQAALSIEATVNSAFSLMHRTDLCGTGSSSCWVLRVPTADSGSSIKYLTSNGQTGGSGVTSTATTGPPVAGAWTHLAVVYDQSTGKDTFYVDGTAVGTVPSPGFSAHGPLVAGRLRASGGYVNFWRGTLDDVRTVQRALSGDEIARVVSGSLRWTFDEGRGTSSEDLAGVSPATLGSAAGWTGAGVQQSSALSLGGTANDYAATSDSPLQAQNAFTVAAWAYLDVAAGTPGTWSVLGQAGAAGAGGPALRFENDGGGTYTWTFSVPRSGGGTTTVAATSAGARRTWVHVAGVQDTANSLLRLYVNGTQVATASLPALTTTNGAFDVGRSWVAGSWQYPWQGAVDDVQVFRAALSAAQVSSLTTPQARFAAQVPGALTGPDQAVSPNQATAYSGATGGYDATLRTNPTTFSLECWFRTTSSTGGQLLGLASQQTDVTSGSADRVLYVSPDGTVRFAVYGTGGQRTQLASAAGLADGGWHHVVATLTTSGAATAQLYVDGVQVDQATGVTVSPYDGYWRWGAARVVGWTGNPTTNALRGTIDEIAVYPTVLSAQQVAEHYYSNF